ncbi:MAG: phosphoglycerate kinase [Patescibacteria group bacterium]
MRTIRDFVIEGKRVLIRSSLNVPLGENGSIEDDFRLRQSIPTIQYAIEKRARCILIGHLGRPEENQKQKIENKKLSLRKVGERLEELLGKRVMFLDDWGGERVQEAVRAMKPGEVMLLENLRFLKGEKENDDDFARSLAGLGDIFVNDAFDACHRAHASIAGIPSFLPSGAGFLLEREIKILSEIREHPQKPMVVIVGGTKVETKADFLDEMSVRADTILTGNPVYEEIVQKGLSFRGSEKIIGPVDGIPQQKGALDIGPRTIALFQEKMRGANTVFWAGPLGKIEEEQYTIGSLAIAKTILKSKAFSVAGGGDLVAFLGEYGLRDQFDHVSTGGGAMLAFLAGEKLPGLEALHGNL